MLENQAIIKVENQRLIRYNLVTIGFSYRKPAEKIVMFGGTELLILGGFLPLRGEHY